jgi:hypothetical protein
MKADEEKRTFESEPSVYRTGYRTVLNVDHCSPVKLPKGSTSS